MAGVVGKLSVGTPLAVDRVGQMRVRIQNQRKRNKCDTQHIAEYMNKWFNAYPQILSFAK